MQSRSSVVVVGSYAKALVMTTNRIPQAGETLIGWGYRQTDGGKGSDMAVQAARLGAHVDYIGVVGNDEFGREFATLLESEGIGVHGLRVTDEQPTGVGLIVKDEAGNNMIVVDMGANGLLSVADVDGAEELKDADVVLTQLEIPVTTALHAMRRAKDMGATTILNPAPAVDLQGQDLSAVDIITPNQSEARVMLGLPPDSTSSEDELAARLIDQGSRAVVITRGQDGAALFRPPPDGGTPVRSDVRPPSVVAVDSNGAGDSFNAALAVALAEGETLEDAVAFGVTVAALCCEHWETVPSYQDRATVEAFVSTHSSSNEGTQA